MLEKGFIKIQRDLTSWRWYKNANTARLFFHLMITANYESRDFEDLEVKRGQRVITYAGLADELGLTVQAVRTAVDHLKSTGDLTISSHRKLRVATLNNYDRYQQGNSSSTDDQQAADSSSTGKQHPNNNNERKKKKDKESKNVEEGCRRFGEYRHVVLSDEQYGRLLSEFGEAVLTKYIRKIDEWIQLKGSQPYNDFELALKGWIEKDGASAKSGDDDGVEKYKSVINRFDL